MSDIIPVNEPLLEGNELDYVADCVKTGWISSAGKYIDRFESEWAAYCGRKYGIAVANGTVALELAVSVLNIESGKEVLMPAFTIVSCIEAILRNGLKPVLVDCDKRTYCMDIEDLKRKITANSAAIMPVHIYGHPVNMEKLLPIAAEHKLKIIEDAAEAHGAECLVNGKWKICGSFGELSCFSFYANKNISCGEGGIVLTDDPTLAEKLKAGRNLCFGAKERFLHEGRGWNFRMTNMQAALGCAQLEQIDKFITRKREMAAMYNNELATLPLHLPFVEKWAKSTVWMYAITLKDQVPFDAVEFASRLMKKGVQTRPFFRAMHEQPVYRALGLFSNEKHPVSEHIYKRGLYLPSGQAITNEQILRAAKAVAEVLS